MDELDELVRYCNEDNNDADHRQARVLRVFLIASLLGGDTGDVRFYDRQGVWYRHASFSKEQPVGDYQANYHRDT